jgi:hypothetical protein
MDPLGPAEFCSQDKLYGGVHEKSRLSSQKCEPLAAVRIGVAGCSLGVGDCAVIGCYDSCAIGVIMCQRTNGRGMRTALARGTEHVG